MAGDEGRQPPSIRVRFRADLDMVDDAFVETALVVAEALPRLIGAFLRGDVDSIPDARDMAADVQARCRHLDEEGFFLLARESPTGGDLRRLVAILRLSTDVERSASLLRHVNETLQYFDPRQLADELRVQVEELAGRSGAVYQAGIDAWRARDPDAIHAVDELDEDVDRLQESLLNRASELDQAGDQMLVLGLVARYFERIADHGVAIARDTRFAVTGDRLDIGY